MLFLPFKFYYYVIKKDRRKYDIIKDANSFIFIVMFPIIAMVLSIILSLLFLPSKLILSLIWLSIFPTNVFFVIRTHEQGLDFEFEENEKRRQEELDELERKIREERRKRWEHEERKRQERERIFERAYREYYKYYREQNTGRPIDRNMQNAIKLLGLEEDFTESDVKKAYRKLARKHHPDVGGLEENFKRLNKAYQYIINNI